MAAKKTSPKAQLKLESRGLEAGGGGPIREGFAFTPEYDRYFALGYPFFRWVADGLPEDKDPEKSATKLLLKYHANERLVWPRETTHRLARAWGTYSVNYKGITPEAVAALKVAGPVDADEVRRIVESQMHNAGGSLTSWHMKNYVFLLEALVGPEVVADAFLDRLELLERDEWIRHDRPDRTQCVKLSGLLLLRMKSSERAKRRARFEALYQKGLDFGEIPLEYGKKGHCLMTRALDILLNGAEGAERSCYRYGANLDIPSPDDFFLVEDADALVRMSDRKHEPGHEDLPETARHAYLGGDALLDVYVKRWPEWMRRVEHLKYFIETFGQIRNERIVRIISEIYATTKAQKEALEWLKAHADYVRPVVSSYRDAWAAGLLKEVG